MKAAIQQIALGDAQRSLVLKMALSRPAAALFWVLHGPAGENKATNGPMTANGGTTKAKRGPIEADTRKMDKY